MLRILYILLLAVSITCCYACLNSGIKSVLGGNNKVEAPEFHIDPHFQLASSYYFNRATYSSYVSISLSGSTVFATAYGGPDQLPGAGTPIESVILNNNNGVLTTAYTLSATTGASNTTNLTVAAAASRDFSIFAVADAQEATDLSQYNYLQIRLLGPVLNVQVTRNLNYPGGFDPTAPLMSFTDDNAYLALCPDNTSSDGTPSLLILSTVDLSTFMTLYLPSYFNNAESVYCLGAYFFSLYDCSVSCQTIDYLAVPTTFTNTTATYAQFTIFRFNRTGNGTLTAVAYANLPQTPNDFKVVPYTVPQTDNNAGKSIRLIVSTTRADLEDEIVSVQYNSSVPSLMDDNGDELRIYEFFSSLAIPGFKSSSGIEVSSITLLELIASDNQAQDVRAVALNPADQGQSMVVVLDPEPSFSLNTNQAAFIDSSAAEELVPRQITCLSEINKIPSTVSFTPPSIINIDRSYPIGDEAFSAQFSLAGTWLVTGNNKGGQNYDITQGTLLGGIYNNINLFNVTYYYF